MTDSKSVPFGGAGSNPADVSFCRFLGLLWYSGSMAPSGGADPGSIPGRGSGSVLVAQLADRPLHTRKAQGSIPCENFAFCYFRGRSSVQSAQRTRLFRPVFVVRYGVVGNMSGSHPVASGSIPGIGLVLLAQLAEHPLNISYFGVA